MDEDMYTVVADANAWACAAWMMCLLSCLSLSGLDARCVNQASELPLAVSSSPTSVSPASIRDQVLWLTLIWTASLLYDGDRSGVIAVGASLDGIVLLTRFAQQAAAASWDQSTARSIAVGSGAGIHSRNMNYSSTVSSRPEPSTSASWGPLEGQDQDVEGDAVLDHHEEPEASAETETETGSRYRGLTGLTQSQPVESTAGPATATYM